MNRVAALVSPWTAQDVPYIAVLVDRPPRALPCPVDLDETSDGDICHVSPGRGQRRRSPSAQLAELHTAVADCLVVDDPPPEHWYLDLAVADQEWEGPLQWQDVEVYQSSFLVRRVNFRFLQNHPCRARPVVRWQRYVSRPYSPIPEQFNQLRGTCPAKVGVRDICRPQLYAYPDLLPLLRLR